MARRPTGRTVAGTLLSCRFHPAGAGERDRLPEQGHRLCNPVPQRGRDACHHRRRSTPSRRPDRRHRGAPYLGADLAAPSTHPLRGAGRRARVKSLLTIREMRRLTDGKVSFTRKDYRHHSKTKAMTLGADEFIRRFLLHSLPDGFHRIRYYGFLANGGRRDNLALCRRLLDAHHVTINSELADAHAKGNRQRNACDFLICPDCGGTMRRIAAVPRSS